MSLKNDKFIWGVATSACQIEGGTTKDGRGLSIWDVFSSVRGNIKNNDTPTIACDSYKKWKEDISLLKYLGVNSYRFSVSWSRILPNGAGSINQKGLDYYRRLCDVLAENNILPNVTLYHWDLPYELEKKGGFLNPEIADRFADYAEIVFKNLPSAKMFSTFNEPIAVYVGYGLKSFAPGLSGEENGRRANHNLLISHGKAVERFRALNLNADIGIVVDVWERTPLDKNSSADIELAARENALAHGSYLRPIFSGRYDDIVLKHLYENKIDIKITESDLKLISQPLDFYGLNCYNRIVVSAEGKEIRKEIEKNGGNFLQNGNEYYPNAIYNAVKTVRKDYGVNIPIFITENGVGFENERLENGVVCDTERITYLKGSLNAIDMANSEGLNIKGYYLWSLMDNFEWTAGYSLKFGIFTRDRKPKLSAEFYKRYIEERLNKNGI